MPVDLPLVCGELWCPNFVQVLDYSIFKDLGHCLKPFIIKMQNICKLIGWNRVHISDIFNCYRANINGMWNARKLGGIC